MKKFKKEPPKKDALDTSERELFLNAFYQGEFLPENKYRKQPKANKEKEARSVEKLDENERELFLRAVEQGLSRAFKIDDDKYVEPSPQRKRAKKRSLVDAEIDLHGMFAADAVNALFRFIDHEKRKGSRTLLVVHGKGSGILKDAVWSYLSTNPLVEDFLSAPGKLGGAGAILVRLKRKVRK